jgi:hypothetical protein
VSIANNVTLGALRIQARQRSDMENNNAVTDSEVNQYISQSWKRLFDMLVAAYGNDYYVAPLFQFYLTSSQYYPLPDGTFPTVGGTTNAPACYKLLDVDLQYSGSPSGWITLKRFEDIERNKYAIQNVAINMLGRTNLKYRLSGTNIKFNVIPMGGQLCQLTYVPKPTPLQFMIVCATTAGSNTVSMSDVTDLSVGMSVYNPQNSVVQPNTTITAINTTLNQVTLSLPTLQTAPITVLSFWTDAATIDGVSGWEEYIVIDTAIKIGVKQENDLNDLRIAKQEMKEAIEGMAEGRDAGQPHHVSDSVGANGYGGDDQDGLGGGGYF